MKGRLISHWRARRGLLTMLALGMAWYALFEFVPLTKVYWAFTNIGQVPPSQVEFVGWANFVQLFATAQFRRAIGNTIIISFLQILVGFPVPIILALLLNEMRHALVKRSIQTVIYLPHFLSWVVVGSIWYIMLSPIRSPNAQLFELLDRDPVFWWASARYIRGLLVATDIWRDAGYGTIIYLASIAAVDQNLYEAARIDGANGWQQAWHVTLASIRSVIIILLILKSGRVLNIFKQVFVLTTPIVRGPSDVLMTYAYRTGIQQGQIAYSMAVSLFKAIVGIALVLVTNAMARRVNEEGVL